jgi:cobalt-zinc-cadmium efflux system outer membrane protein
VKISMKLAALTAAVTTVSSAALADAGPACSVRITRGNLVRCVLAASLTLSSEQREMDAVQARKLAVSPWLPSNPVLSFSGSSRSVPERSAFNWDATLSQEIEVAGQRGLRRDAAQAAIDAQTSRVTLARRDAAALAWTAFFEVLSAREEQALTQYLQGTTQAVSNVARARADSGLTAPVDADVADAVALRSLQANLAADRRAAIAQALLASALGFVVGRAALVIEGGLTPVDHVVEAATARLPHAPEQRLEVMALDAERRAFELRAAAFRRTRIPNPTLSLFAQNDGFNEHVFGAGLSLPIPLPGNVGRTYLGEIAEAEALAQKAAIDRERLARAIRLEILTALSTFNSRAAEVQAFTSERVTRARETLRSLGEEVEAGRLSVRDALVAQQALVELLQADIAARRAWCLSSVELARAAGVSLEGETP